MSRYKTDIKVEFLCCSICVYLQQDNQAEEGKAAGDSTLQTTLQTTLQA